MYRFHKILIGNILKDLKEGGCYTLERSTLYRLEVKLGFAKEDRASTDWRTYSKEEAAAFKIAVFRHYGDPVPNDLKKILRENPEVSKLIERAKKKEVKLRNLKLKEKQTAHLAG